jgi:hypothetical protein
MSLGLPHRLRRCRHWLPLRAAPSISPNGGRLLNDHLLTEAECEEHALRTLAEVLLSRGHEEDPYWDREAEWLLAALIEALRVHPQVVLHELRTILRQIPSAGADTVFGALPHAERTPRLQSYLLRPEVERRGIEAQLMRRLQYLTN